MQLRGQINMPPTRKLLKKRGIQSHRKDKQFNKILHRHHGRNFQTKNIRQQTLVLKWKKYSNNTTLSAYIWKLKDQNITPSITWEVIKSTPAYNKISRRCLLCLHDKVRNNHRPVTISTIKLQIRDNLKMSIWKQTPSMPIRPKNLIKTLTKFLPTSHFWSSSIIFIFTYISVIYVHITR